PQRYQGVTMPHPCPHHCPPSGGGGIFLAIGAVIVLAAAGLAAGHLLLLAGVTAATGTLAAAAVYGLRRLLARVPRRVLIMYGRPAVRKPAYVISAKAAPALSPAPPRAIEPPRRAVPGVVIPAGGREKVRP